MNRVLVSILLVWALPWTAAQRDQRASEKHDAPFWHAPTVELDLRSLSSAQVKLIAGPDASRKFALLQTGEDATTANFVPNNPRVAPFHPDEDTGYRLIPGGLKEGAFPYGDRKYKIQKLNPLLSGLPLLQTKSAHKAIVDSRYSVILAVTKPCYVFVALDERALKTYTAHGTPSWLQEFAPTGHKLVTDDPIMAPLSAGYLVFVRKTPAGRIALGPPGLSVSTNSMYFAFFAEAE